MPKLYSTSYSNIEELENEINNMVDCNPEIEINDIQIFVEINENNYYPIDMNVQDRKIHIKNNDFIVDKKLYIGSKRQFISKSY